MEKSEEDPKISTIFINDRDYENVFEADWEFVFLKNLFIGKKSNSSDCESDQKIRILSLDSGEEGISYLYQPSIMKLFSNEVAIEAIKPYTQLR